MWPYLDSNAFTYVFADIRGYGESRDIKGEFTAKEVAKDIITLANHLDWDQFNLIGHSMTGMVVQ
jgi:3-oxoadipate enol-lactonase